ncbi:DEAD/DEAH box helicase [Akkermansiaceae bacterium]|nr:DEAD/DEAH box helicase [Akkermansiaceae bacterium]
MPSSLHPGNLVRLRDREWVVQPSSDSDLLLLRPLGGTDEEIAGIYLPLEFEEDEPVEHRFPHPTNEDLGDYARARLLHDASRLSFRNGAGPFRCLAKLSFRPRSYQMVPLIMALKQEVVRLLIADDVGVGKTIEALLIIKELLERRVIKRFAVICLPHLCDQWQQEIKDKIGIEAVVIRSNTQAKLDREIQDDTPVFQYYSFQVISIDYIKTDAHRHQFLADTPELCIVDEVHTCARPEGASDNQQRRFSLLKEIAKEENQHLIMLTATPHSGKSAQFHSLLGLLKPEFEDAQITSTELGSKKKQADRRHLARHFIQRRRADVEKWMSEDTPFPKRDPGEFNYDLSPSYSKFFDDLLGFVRTLIAGDQTKKVHYWTALGLLRGVMSSPAAGISMLRNRRDRVIAAEELDEFTENPVLDSPEGFESDATPKELVELTEWNWRQVEQLKEFEDRLEKLTNPTQDQKLLAAQTIIESWLLEGLNPVIFCRYISTANYLGKQLKKLLAKSKPAKLKKAKIEVVTSEDPDELRRQRIESMADQPGEKGMRILIATDCLSEGINLHELFTAVLHYDLPWNPNRLEQREGRVDRFGQVAPIVKTLLLFSPDNPVDGAVFKVILRKVIEIKKATGINMPFPEDSQSIIDTIANSILVSSEEQLKARSSTVQDELPFEEFDQFKKIEDRVTDSFNRSIAQEKATRSIFAQNAIKAGEIEKDLQDNDRAIGNPQAVEEFITESLRLLGGQIEKDEDGYLFYPENLPDALQAQLPLNRPSPLKVSFHSPCPRERIYLGRNHLFVEQVCQFILSATMERARLSASRAAVLRTDLVKEPTTLFLLRARNVICEKKDRSHELVAEEMVLLGFRGDLSDRNIIEQEECYELLYCASPSSDLTTQRRERLLEGTLAELDNLRDSFDNLALSRAQNLVEAHERFSELVNKDKFSVVTPVLPMDVLGIYLLIPA